MCLIIHAEKSLPDIDLMKSAHHNNSNGFGLMYLNDSNRVVTEKIVPGTFSDIEKVLERHPKDQEIGLHFRMTTKGATVPEMSHPFQILDHNKHGRDLWLMHNGPSLPVALLEDGKSDTWHFVNYILRPMLVNHPELIEEQEFIRMLDRMIGSEKLLFLDTKKGFVVVNKAGGKSVDDMWLSNTYSINRNKGMNYNVNTKQITQNTPNTPTAYGYNQNRQQRYGGQHYGHWNSNVNDFGDFDDWDYDPMTGACTRAYSYNNNSKQAITTPPLNSTVERLTFGDYEDRIPANSLVEVTTEELLDAYTEDRLYELVLDRFESVVNWLRSNIKMDEAV